jgi:hypothetical protein
VRHTGETPVPHPSLPRLTDTAALSSNFLMRLEAITIAEGPDQHESLAMCLQALAAVEGVSLDYDDLCAALGVSFAAVSTTAEPAPGWWMTFARDAFLAPAAQLFGIHLRDLHPPDVAVEMLTADEYGQHWEHSYKPLIRSALENREPLLAWQGWPGVSWPFWGIITGQAGDAFEGLTIWAGAQRLPIGGPGQLPLQCYVVENCEPGFPPRTDLFATAMQHADAYMNRAPYAPTLTRDTSLQVVTGPAAFDAWERWLESEPAGTAAGSPPWNEHRQHAELIASARASAARFLRRMYEVVEPERRGAITEAIAHCDTVAEWLSASRDEAAVRQAFSTSQGREKLLASVNAAEAADRRLAVCVERLAQPLPEEP